MKIKAVKKRIRSHNKRREKNMKSTVKPRKTWNDSWGPNHTECTGCGTLWKNEEHPKCECQEIIDHNKGSV